MALQLTERVVPLASLKLDPRNAKVHGERNLAVIRASFEKFGQVEPLVVNKRTGQVVGGHGRVTVMQEMGWTETKIVEVDLDDQAATELALVLNRSAELGEWDVTKLGGLITDLQGMNVDLSAIGWDANQIKSILSQQTEASSPSDFKTVDENLETSYQCPKCSYCWSGKPR